jgi:hypothetical protein
VGLWIDHAILAALQRERGAGEGYSEVILRLAQAATLGEPLGGLGGTGSALPGGGFEPAADTQNPDTRGVQNILTFHPKRLWE